MNVGGGVDVGEPCTNPPEVRRIVVKSISTNPSLVNLYFAIMLSPLPGQPKHQYLAEPN